jgi:hypothetical protein
MADPEGMSEEEEEEEGGEDDDEEEEDDEDDDEDDDDEDDEEEEEEEEEEMAPVPRGKLAAASKPGKPAGARAVSFKPPAKAQKAPVVVANAAAAARKKGASTAGDYDFSAL